MITLKEYNESTTLVEDLKATYDTEVILSIFLNLELMNLRNKIDSAVLCMDELSTEIDLLIIKLFCFNPKMATFHTVPNTL